MCICNRVERYETAGANLREKVCRPFVSAQVSAVDVPAAWQSSWTTVWRGKTSPEQELWAWGSFQLECQRYPGREERQSRRMGRGEMEEKEREEEGGRMKVRVSYNSSMCSYISSFVGSSRLHLGCPHKHAAICPAGLLWLHWHGLAQARPRMTQHFS